MDSTENSIKVIKHIKDNSYKELFANPELFIQFVKHFLDIDILKDIEPKDVIDCTGRYNFLFIEEKNNDTVKIIEVKKDIFVIAMIEHQSQVCYDMPGSTKSKSFKLPPILPVVYYTGTGNWTADINFNKRVYLREEFSRYTPNFNYEVVSLGQYKIEDLMKYENILSFMMILDKIKEPEKIKEELNKLTEDYINKVNESIPDNLLELLKNIVFLFLTKINVPKEEKEEIEKLIYERRFSDMLETIEYYDVQKERKIIREEAREEAEKEREKRVKKMINKGSKIEDIADIFEMSISDIKKIQSKMDLS